MTYHRTSDCFLLVYTHYSLITLNWDRGKLGYGSLPDGAKVRKACEAGRKIEVSLGHVF